MEDLSKTDSFRRWYRGRYVAVSEFLEGTQRERELDAELFRQEQQQTDPGLGKSETPSTPSNNDDGDEDSGSSNNPGMGPGGAGPSDPDPGTGAGPESSGENVSARVIYVLSYLGSVCDIIIEFILQIPA